MTSNEITAVAFKVFAIYVFVNMLLAIPSFVQAVSSNFYNDDSSTPYLAVGATALACLLLIGITISIWKLSVSITKRAISSTHEKSDFNMSEGFILSVVGLYLAFEGAQSIFYNLIGIYMQLHGKYGTHEVEPESLAYLFSYVVQVVFAFSLIFRAEGWSSVLTRIRESGLNAKPSNK